MADRKKAPRTANGNAFGILNPWGDVWTYEHFDTPAAARQHLADFWKGCPGERLDRYKIVPVRVRVSAIKDAPALMDGAGKDLTPNAPASDARHEGAGNG